MQDIPSVSLIVRVCWIGAISSASLLTYPFPTSPPPCISVIDRTGVLYIYEDMSIHPPRCSAEEKPTREQLTGDLVGAAVTSRQPTGQSIAANNQNQSSVSHSRHLWHCHIHRSCWGWLPSYVAQEEVSDLLHSLTFSLTSGWFRFCPKKRYLCRSAEKVAPC